jgi:hypothetical protein
MFAMKLNYNTPENGLRISHASPAERSSAACGVALSALDDINTFL